MVRVFVADACGPASNLGRFFTCHCYSKVSRILEVITAEASQWPLGCTTLFSYVYQAVFILQNLCESSYYKVTRKQYRKATLKSYLKRVKLLTVLMQCLCMLIIEQVYNAMYRHFYQSCTLSTYYLSIAVIITFYIMVCLLRHLITNTKDSCSIIYSFKANCLPYGNTRIPYGNTRIPSYK